MGMVNALRALGHTVEISSPPGCDPERKIHDVTVGVEGGRARLRTRLKAFAREAPPALFEVGELAYNVWSFWDMTRRARHKRPDLIYERTTSNSLVPTWLACSLGVPIVQEVNVTSEIGRLRPLVLGNLTRRIERWMAANSTAFLTVSEQFRRQIIDAGFPADRVFVCQNAIDPDEFDPDAVGPVKRPRHVGDHAFVLGYVGAFVPYHKLDLLVGAARELKGKVPGVRWLLVGDGVDKPRIESLIERRRLRASFWLPGRVPHELVPAFVQAMDVAVLPNSEAFNSPMKLFEYMSMAKPVIAPRVPAIEEVIRDGENGLLFEPGDLDGFCGAAARLSEDAEFRERIGRHARQCVLTNHTWEGNAKRMLETIAGLNGRPAEEPAA
jgi:glycosyltransferase involved in cell wall biosynthesis